MGRFTVSLPDEWDAELEAAAAAERRSKTMLAAIVIEDWLRWRRTITPPPLWPVLAQGGPAPSGTAAGAPVATAAGDDSPATDSPTAAESGGA